MYRIVVVLLLDTPALTFADSGAYLQILGISQDAGYAQTNCYQPHCMRAWQKIELRRMASSIAIVDTREKTKYLFDAAPDMREQLYDLHRAAPDSEYLLDGAFLTHAPMGHYTGLMHFGREGVGAKEIPVDAMPRMLNFLVNNGPWGQLFELKNIELRRLGFESMARINPPSSSPILISGRTGRRTFVMPYVR